VSARYVNCITQSALFKAFGSAHGFGIAIDIAAAHFRYWLQ